MGDIAAMNEMEIEKISGDITRFIKKHIQHGDKETYMPLSEVLFEVGLNEENRTSVLYYLKKSDLFKVAERDKMSGILLIRLTEKGWK